MAITKLAKRNPPEPGKKRGVMKLCFDNHFSSHIFWHFLYLQSYNFNVVIIHNILLRQVAHEEIDENQLWFQIGEHWVHLSIGE